MWWGSLHHKRISEHNRIPVNSKRNPADYCKVGVEGSLVPTDFALGKGRRKSWFGDLGAGDAASTGSGGKSGEGAQPQLLNGSNPNSRVRRGSLVTDVDNLQGGEAATKRLKEQVEVSVMNTGCKRETHLPYSR